MKRVLMLFAACVLSLALVQTVEAQVGYVAYYAAPACCAPAPVVVTSYYAPVPVVAYQAFPVATTRWRPILGGTVTRIRPAYAPVVIGY